MKECPFCKAQIEENARFCLYCMKPLKTKEQIVAPREKRSWWIWPLVLLVVIGVSVLLLRGRQPGPSAQAPIPTMDDIITQPSTEETTSMPANMEETIPEVSADGGAFLPEKDPIPKQTEPSVTLPEPSVPKQTVPQLTEPEYTEPELTEPQMQPETTQPPEIQTPQQEAEYLYRAARAGDDFNAQYTNTGNDIVITGVTKQTDNGVYHIPSYIDGKRVLAIAANAFHGTNARVVYVPSTVRNIWNYAFYGCGLTDIYFHGNSIYTESMAFSGSITIHCSANCSDRNLRYYKNSAASCYGAVWEEWNG